MSPDRFKRIYRWVALIWLATVVLYLASGPFFRHAFNDRNMVGDIDRYEKWVSYMHGFFDAIILVSFVACLASIVGMIRRPRMPWWWSVPLLLASLMLGLSLWLAMILPGGVVVT